MASNTNEVTGFDPTTGAATVVDPNAPGAPTPTSTVLLTYDTYRRRLQLTYNSTVYPSVPEGNWVDVVASILTNVGGHTFEYTEGPTVG